MLWLTRFSGLYPEKEDKSRVSKLKIVRKKFFANLIVSLPLDKQKEINGFYNELCDYVHLSETIKEDALSDFAMNLALSHPYYKEDVRRLKKTLGLNQYLLMKNISKLLQSSSKYKIGIVRGNQRYNVWHQNMRRITYVMKYLQLQGSPILLIINSDKTAGWIKNTT